MDGPGEVATKVAVVRGAVAELLVTDIAALPVTEASALYAELKVAADQARVFAARLLAHVEADGRWSAGHSRTFPEWVARGSLGSVSGARSEVALGRALAEDLPATATAVAAGQIYLEHAQVLARLAPTSDARRATLAGTGVEDNEAFLVDQARRLPVDEYRRVVKCWAARVDEAMAERSHEVAAAKEHLTMSRRDDGVALQGLLTHEHGSLLLTALRAVSGVPSADDDRTHEQRQGNALAGLARLVLDGGLAGGAQVRPHLSVHVSWETIQRLGREHAGGTATGTGSAGAVPGASGAGPGAPAELDEGEPIPMSVLARIACDSDISRVVFGPQGQVLDVSRVQRTYGGQLRRAIIARDRRCQYPGCCSPARMGEVHHVVPWARGGATSVRNGILLCWFHHKLVHSRGVVIRWDPRLRWVFSRDGVPIRSPSSPGGWAQGSSAPPGGAGEGDRAGQQGGLFEVAS